MSISVLSVTINILTDLHQNTDGSGGVTQETIARYLNDGQKLFNDLTLILRTNTIIPAVAAQIEYDLPSTFKQNLSRVEFDKKFLIKKNKDWFDENDSQWRDPAIEKTGPPLYYTAEMVEEGKFLIYPPAEETGGSRNIFNNNGQIKRSVTFNGTTTNLFTSNGSILRTVTVNGEVFNLFTGGGNILRTITPRDNNIYIEYVEEPADINILSDIAPKLEKYITSLEDYTKHRYNESADTPVGDANSVKFLGRFLEKTTLVKKMLNKSRSKLPTSIRPVFKRHQLGSKQVHLTS